MKRKLLVETLGSSLPRDLIKRRQNSVDGAKTLNEMTLQNVRVTQGACLCAHPSVWGGQAKG